VFRLKLSSYDAQLHVKTASEYHLLGKVPQVISGQVYVTTILRHRPMRFGQGASLNVVQARWHCAPLVCHSCHIHVAHFCIIGRCLIPGIASRIKLTTFDASSCALSSRSLSLCDLFSQGRGCVLLHNRIIRSPLWAKYTFTKPPMVGQNCPSAET